MKKFLFAALALFIGSGAFAQDVRVGIKAGGNLSTCTNTYLDMKFGFHIGGFLDFKFDERFGLQPEVLFSTQGAVGKSKGQGLYLKYINVPVLLKISIVEGISAEIGPQIGFLVSSDARDMGAAYDYEPRSTIDVTIVGGLSYTFAENFIVSARYGLGLTNIFNSDYIYHHKNRVIQLSVGYKF